MSKAPKTKKASLHYQPYQAVNNGDHDEACMDLSMADVPLHLDPVLSGLSSNMSRNLWDDWNEQDPHFDIKLDMYADDASSPSPNPTFHHPPEYETPAHVPSSGLAPEVTRSPRPPINDKEHPRDHLPRSLSEDLVHMLENTTHDTAFPSHLDTSAFDTMELPPQVMGPAAARGPDAMLVEPPQPPPLATPHAFPPLPTLHAPPLAVPTRPPSVPARPPVPPTAHLPATSPPAVPGYMPPLVHPFLMYPPPSAYPLPMHVQLHCQLQWQLQLAHLAQCSMGFPPFPSTLHPPAAPVSGRGTSPSSSMSHASGNNCPTLVPIARKPGDPHVSSVFQSLLEEEAKKKEKKLERNRESARESRKKQQTYVETLEQSIQRLHLDRESVRTYRWGRTDACKNARQLSDALTRVTAHEPYPPTVHALMTWTRQRQLLVLPPHERERRVRHEFALIGRHLALLRTHLVQLLLVRTLEEHPALDELKSALNLTRDQVQQLQHVGRLDHLVLELTKVVRVFFALRNEALLFNRLAPSLERSFVVTCSREQLEKLVHWTASHAFQIEKALESVFGDDR
ncbi:hypothetical protein PsorP6_012900 [Peronosclerospora sorghi]|uniref:Uncharacterized protein n=1 Tax=Peronosclerospora sorghi TaxID=230839 RepID=A0ACC0WES3_9STRA|nr:hypothetical protein PsorP6_012900 [Peronosclerospora sorghi]